MSLAWPECAHPRCDGKAGDPMWDVCEAHKPAPLDTPAKLSALAADCQLTRHSNGWRISHWTGAYLPVPLLAVRRRIWWVRSTVTGRSVRCNTRIRSSRACSWMTCRRVRHEP